MAKPKFSLPRGFHDYVGSTAQLRAWLSRMLADTFELYGFSPIETPAVEQTETLTSQYGQEANKLIFNVLESGDKFKKGVDAIRKDAELPHPDALKKLSKRALRYDLTAPLRRFLQGYQGGIPFKCYHIAPVWRADRPQKNRFREFIQCDVDTIFRTDPDEYKNGLWALVDFLLIIKAVMDKLGIDNYEIQINHTDCLANIAEGLGCADRQEELAIILDKADKLSVDGVMDELEDAKLLKNAPEEASVLLKKMLQKEHTLDEIEGVFPKVVEMETLCFKFIMDGVLTNTLYDGIKINTLLSRGLSYYQGFIFEVRLPDVETSVAGGGMYPVANAHYDDLYGMGFSFGLERLYNAWERIGFNRKLAREHIRVFVRFDLHHKDDSNRLDTATYHRAVELVGKLRKASINAVLQNRSLGKSPAQPTSVSVPFVSVKVIPTRFYGVTLHWQEKDRFQPCDNQKEVLQFITELMQRLPIDEGE